MRYKQHLESKLKYNLRHEALGCNPACDSQHKHNCNIDRKGDFLSGLRDDVSKKKKKRFVIRGLNQDELQAIQDDCHFHAEPYLYEISGKFPQYVYRKVHSHFFLSVFDTFRHKRFRKCLVIPSKYVQEFKNSGIDVKVVKYKIYVY